MNISLRQLEYLLAAARAGSVSGAARSMNVSSSSIFMAIDKFEEEFAIQVFVRQRASGLMLTTEGKRAIERTIRLLDEVRAFQGDLTTEGDRLEGNVDVACFSSLSPNILPQVIRTMQDQHPGVVVNLVEGDMITIQDHLRSGLVDLLLSYDNGMPADFELEFLAEAPPHAVIAANDPLAQNESISLEELIDRPLLLLNLPQSSRYAIGLFERAGLRPRNIRRVASFEMVRSAAAANLGVAVLNIKPATDTTYSGLEVVCRPILPQHYVPRIVLATRKGGRLGRNAETFARCCSDFFRTDAAKSLFVHAPKRDDGA
ncbi:LysR family transcriptional regulator [Seohaeicola zhoushanensis]|uniref:LysR family transcriptional regulator n=1 Tax=Seohaeicola zhoushanensis TaxID=1569283 RepID=A0A8J3GXB4_9RHOB|nr:LysR family transcriptional regulator [Seohaeicola zhoushanensis]GHF46276.1 LysR family transcriptional regulator [Seohaeicola zhoushanensis]